MKNRDMFYQNTHTSYNNPGMFIPPQGYNINTEYQAYGPNIGQNMYQNNPNMINTNDYEERISAIERHIKNIDNRLQKLESTSTLDDKDNFYMI